MNSVATEVIELGGVATALIAIVVIWRYVTAPIRKLHFFLDDWFGTEARPGVPARLGVMARLDAIEHELHPNSQLSMRDAIDRIEKATAITPKIERIAAAVDGGAEALHQELPPSS